MTVYELNMDGLVGPTHHYAGLAPGNIASVTNALNQSNPQAAALQGLEKMHLLQKMGLKQGLLPPHQRPNLHLLHQLGFTGSATEQIRKAKKYAPELLSAAYSASSMWTANAATCSPSTDTRDGRVHFTAANLVSNLHRHQEADFSRLLLQTVFADPLHFQHHLILPQSAITGDEGAANHNRLCQNHAQRGINLFVYGKNGIGNKHLGPIKYPARQTLEASMAIARGHLLSENQVMFVRQNPNAIDQGVFHNDVISVANEFVFLVHEEAFCDQADVLKELQDKANFPLTIIEVPKEFISLQDAVSTYLFNSQLITLPQGMTFIAPKECEQNIQVKSYLDSLIQDNSNPIQSVHYLDLKQSMKNGGGPACLRLRVVLNNKELSVMHQGVLLNDELYTQLQQWVMRHYRTELLADDLIDPHLIIESFTALDELTQLLALGSIYPFQQE